MDIFEYDSCLPHVLQRRFRQWAQEAYCEDQSFESFINDVCEELCGNSPEYEELVKFKESNLVKLGDSVYKPVGSISDTF